MAVNQVSHTHPTTSGLAWLSWAAYHLLSLEAVLVLTLHAKHLKNLLPGTPIPEVLFYGGLSFAIGLWLILRQGIYRQGLPVVIAGLLLTAWLVASYGWSPSTIVAKENMPFILGINLWSVVAGACIVASSRERVLRFLLLLVLLSTIISLNGLYIYLTHGDFRSFGYGDADWGVRTYLAWSNIVASGTAVTIAIAAHTRFGSPKQAFALAILSIGFFFLMISSARGALLAVIVAGLVALFIDKPRISNGRILMSKTQLALLGVVTVLIGYIVYLLATGQPTSTLTRLLRLFDQADDPLQRLGPNRFDTFAAAYRAWLDSPIIGQGLAGSFNFLCGREINPCYPHNAILQMLADHGLVGLVLFLAFVAVGARRLSFARLREDPLLLALTLGFVTVLFHLMVASDTVTHYRLFLFLGLLAMPPPPPDEDDEDDYALQD